MLCFWAFLTGQICGGYGDAVGCPSSPEIVKKEMVYIKKSSRTVLEAPAQVEDEEESWFTLMQS